jgi:hypothetical protein
VVFVCYARQVDLLALDDPVFVIDLTPQTMALCRADLDDEAGASSASTARQVDDPPDPPIRAVAFVLDWEEQPVLVGIRPTRDMQMLDALARLIRMSLLTGVTAKRLATECGDDEIGRLYEGRRFPGFVYEGIAGPPRERLPHTLKRIFADRRSGAI